MFFSKKRLDSLNVKMPRSELVRRSRILVIDDERPDLIDDLKAAHFSVDHVEDVDSRNMELIERSLYDLILLDFGDVGKAFGEDQGMSLLKHIKRVNPGIIVFSYTSKALETQHADFYREADGVLAKDAGIQESLEKIEDGLRQAHSLDNIWTGLLAICDVRLGSKEDIEWQDLFVRARKSQRKMKSFQSRIRGALTSETSQEIAVALLNKLIGLAIAGTFGA